jgi:hypothetical protein
VLLLLLPPPHHCCCCRQVITFAMFRLMREVDGDLAEEQLSRWPYSSSSSSGGGGELLLLQYVRQGGFSKLCDVLSQVGAADGAATATAAAPSSYLQLPASLLQVDWSLAACSTPTDFEQLCSLCLLSVHHLCCGFHCRQNACCLCCLLLLLFLLDFLLLLLLLWQVEDGSAHELAFSMLLSMSLIPEAQQVLAERGEVHTIVKVCHAACACCVTCYF